MSLTTSAVSLADLNQVWPSGTIFVHQVVCRPGSFSFQLRDTASKWLAGQVDETTVRCLGGQLKDTASKWLGGRVRLARTECCAGKLGQLRLIGRAWLLETSGAWDGGYWTDSLQSWVTSPFLLLPGWWLGGYPRLTEALWTGGSQPFE
jgi:hypothetical protein